MTESPTSSLIIEMNVPQMAKNKHNKKGRAVKLRVCNRLWEKVSEILRVAKRKFDWNLKFSVILAFCSMLKGVHESDIMETPLFVNRCFSVQLLHFLPYKPVSHCGQQLSQVILLNGASCFIKVRKSISDDIFQICTI